ncbi:MAG: DnaD domain protein [Oscillospiraceae bacterium]
METRKYSFAGGFCLSIPPETVDKLLSTADGTCALVYLYILRHNGELSVEKASVELRRTERELSAAVEKLASMGLIAAPSARAIALQPDEIPEYTTEDVVRRSATDSEFGAVVEDAQRIFGHILSAPDLKRLFGLYDFLGLSGEIILMLIHFCCEEFAEKYGSGRIPSMRYIEKEARRWVDREIYTMERAEAYIRNEKEKQDAVMQVKQVLQIRGRDLSATERKYVSDWLDKGFGVEALAIAYDRTVVKTGRLQWKYMNSIVENWHEKNLHTPEEIEQGDVLPARTASERRNGAFAPSVPQQDDLDLMEARILGGFSGKKP